MRSSFFVNFDHSLCKVGVNFKQSWSNLRAKLEQTPRKVGPALLEAKCVAYRCIFHFASGEESVAIVWSYEWQISVSTTGKL